MDANNLTSMEIDAIGEILNISLGSAATAISTMLSSRVDITSPKVQVRQKDSFEFSQLEPAVGVEIAYQEGLTGSNVMVLKRSDVGIIISMLLGYEYEADFELDEISTSAIGEVMNQMMGASSTAMAEMLAKTVDITTPVVFEIEDSELFKEKYFSGQELMVEINFTLTIGDKVSSEFINMLPLALVKTIVSGFFKESGIEVPGQDSQAETPAAVEEVAPAPTPVVEPVPVVASAPVAAAPAPVVASAPVASAPVASPVMNDQLNQTLTQMTQLMQQQMMMTQAALQSAQGNKKIKVNPIPQPNLNLGEGLVVEDANLDLVMGVPVEVSVEIGRTKKLVKDILELNKGSLVVLDKMAGEQVDLFVNGRCIAHGDVVVVDDSFAIRITEIISEESEG